MRNDDVANRVTARALGVALHPSCDEASAAVLLADVGTPLALRHALARVQRGLVERPSAVGDRAERCLLAAIELADARVLAQTHLDARPASAATA